LSSKTPAKKSPLKAKPLRLPGQSLQDEINNLIDDKIESYLLYPLVFFVVAFLEWAGWYYELPRQPWLYTALAIGFSCFAAYRIIPIRRRIKLLKQARDGEKAVGQFLESLRAQGHHVFHDIIGEGFNIDHVVIGPKGVFTVETKTISKPIRGEAKVVYDGVMIRVDGYKPARDPIVQAKAQANWLKELFLEETGKKIAIQPIVVYPGWYIDGPPKGIKHTVWVLNPKGLPTYIENRREALADTDVHLLKASLSRRVRQSNS
jgi:hypothetical protein